jgi:hypothetical protein
MPDNAPLAEQHDRVHAERHRVERPGHRRSRSPGVGRQPRLSRVPLVAESCRRSGALRRAADRPRSGAGHHLRDGPADRARDPCTVRRVGHPFVHQDHGEPRVARVRAAGAVVGFGAGAVGGRGRGPRAGSSPARADHRLVVERGAGRADLHRLQPERTPQDGVRPVVPHHAPVSGIR